MPFLPHQLSSLFVKSSPELYSVGVQSLDWIPMGSVCQTMKRMVFVHRWSANRLIHDTLVRNMVYKMGELST